jgi:predicted CXXCH cytochrome family protein
VAYTADTWARYFDNQWKSPKGHIPTRNLTKEKEMKTLISSRWHRMVTVPLSVALMGAGLLFSGAAFAQTTTIVGSAHDFSDDAALIDTGNEICVVCHAPHNTYNPTEGNVASVAELGPLWNRALTQVTSYSMYNATVRVGSDIDATDMGVSQPSGVSKLCLSCHDGTIAIDSYGRDTNGVPVTGANLVTAFNANANIGEGSGTTGVLENDHPVGFTFTSNLDDTEIAGTAGGEVVGLKGTNMPLFGTGNDQMECATCHDVHATGTFDKLLRVQNNNAADPSALCLNCHDK